MAAPEPAPRDSQPPRRPRRSWVFAVVFGALLGLAVWFGFYAWTLFSPAAMNVLGRTFVLMGAILGMGLGAGLMVLIFYSNREGYDR